MTKSNKRRMRRIEDVPKAERKDNQYDLSGSFGVGYTTNTNEAFYFDLEDFDKIKNYCWREDQGYIVAKIHGKKIRMHQLLYSKGCDHIDRNRKNNQKSNLRDATQMENTQNRSLMKNNKSGFTGVYYDKNHNGWCVQITVNKNQLYLGCFSSKDEAIRTRLEAEATYFGDFAPQRHLFEQYGIVNTL